MLDFPSLSQVPTCMHPAPKRRQAQAPAVEEEEEESDKGTSSTFSHAPFTEVPLGEELHRLRGERERGGGKERKKALTLHTCGVAFTFRWDGSPLPLTPRAWT